VATRGERGRFVAGNPGGPGRPKKAVERAYLDELVDVVTAREWRAIVRKAVTDAKDGDAAARAWLSRHLLGDDPPAVASLVEELRAELERLRHGNGAYERGTAPAGRGAATNGDGKSAAGATTAGPGPGDDPCGSGSGCVAEDGAVLPLFAGAVAGEPPVRQEHDGCRAGGP